VDLLSSNPFWPIQDGLIASYPRLQANLDCDVVVIGGGITGALVSWHLAEAGIDTVVVDRRDIGHGSTAGSTNLLQYELDEPLYRLAEHFGTDFAVRAYERCADAVKAIGRLARRLRIDCSYEEKQSLLLARNRTHLGRLRREFEARRAAGFDVTWWPRRKLKGESTLPHPAAILSRIGAQVDAYRLTHGLFQAACTRGVRVFDQTDVTSVRRERTGVRLQIRGGRRIRARRLVIAAGYEAGAFLPMNLASLHSTYALVSEPGDNFSGWPANRCLIWETGNPYTYWRTTPDGRVIIGGYDEPFRDQRQRDRCLAEKTQALQRKFRQCFPRIPLEVAYAWAGTFAVTPHGLPLIGAYPGIPHTWFALGYGGNGITFSLVAAEIIRDGILGRTDRDADVFGFEAP
jgi:glycine/D-amino acid oxidase-like deaminating enzyme